MYKIPVQKPVVKNNVEIPFLKIKTAKTDIKLIIMKFSFLENSNK